MTNHSSKSTPIVFSNTASAAAWAYHLAQDNPNTFPVVVTRDEYGYFIVTPNARIEGAPEAPAVLPGVVDDEDDYAALLEATWPELNIPVESGEKGI